MKPENWLQLLAGEISKEHDHLLEELMGIDKENASITSCPTEVNTIFRNY